MPQLLPETVKAVRDKIEKAAIELFIKQGYAATTTRQIARAVGSSAGAIYTHYKSKKDLFAAVTHRSQEMIRGQDNPVHTVLEQSRFPFDLPELGAAIKSLVQEHRAYWLLWYVDVIEFGGKHFQPMLAPQVLLQRDDLQQRFAELRREKRLRVPPETAFIMIYMHLFNYFLVETLFGGHQHYGVSEEQAIRSISESFLHGVLA